jgi:hypothetical protein
MGMSNATYSTGFPTPCRFAILIKCLYWEYEELSGKYIIVGHFEKLKKDYIDKVFIGRGRTWDHFGKELIDVKTGGIAKNNAGMAWRCIDIVLDGKDYT